MGCTHTPSSSWKRCATDRNEEDASWCERYNQRTRCNAEATSNPHSRRPPHRYRDTSKNATELSHTRHCGKGSIVVAIGRVVTGAARDNKLRTVPSSAISRCSFNLPSSFQRPRSTISYRFSGRSLMDRREVCSSVGSSSCSRLREEEGQQLPLCLCSTAWMALGVQDMWLWPSGLRR